MSLRSNRITLCALAATAALALAAPAQAKLVGSAFDPPLFDGIGTFLLPDIPACLGLGGGFQSVNGGSDACTGVILLSAAVNASDSGGTAHLSLPPPTPDAMAVSGIVIDTEAPQLVVGVNTGMIPIFADACTGDLCDFQWWIQWDSGLPGGEFLSNSVSLFAQYCPEGCFGDVFRFGDPAVDVKFFLTPEPGSLALLVGALGAVWMVRRRRARA
jgi:hypothetical protein